MAFIGLSGIWASAIKKQIFSLCKATVTGDGHGPTPACATASSQHCKDPSPPPPTQHWAQTSSYWPFSAALTVFSFHFALLEIGQVSGDARK